MCRLRLFEDSYHKQMHALVSQVSASSLFAPESLKGGAPGMSDFLLSETKKLHHVVIALSRSRRSLGPGVNQVE